MKTDIINGFEWLIFSEQEREEARAAAKKNHRVLIATICVECGNYIEARLGDLRPRHTEGYHASLYR